MKILYSVFTGLFTYKIMQYKLKLIIDENRDKLKTFNNILGVSVWTFQIFFRTLEPHPPVTIVQISIDVQHTSSSPSPCPHRPLNVMVDRGLHKEANVYTATGIGLYYVGLRRL